MPAKEKGSSLRMAGESFTEINWLYWKAPIPMDTTDGGILRVSKALLWKAHASIRFREEGNSKERIFGFEGSTAVKEFVAMVWTFSGMMVLRGQECDGVPLSTPFSMVAHSRREWVVLVIIPKSIIMASCFKIITSEVYSHYNKKEIECCSKMRY